MSRLRRHIQIARVLCARAPETPPNWQWRHHRAPPLPFYRLKPEPGRCRICWGRVWPGGQYRGPEDAKTPRNTWHRACADAYNFWMTPTGALLGPAQDWRCAGCGVEMARRREERVWDAQAGALRDRIATYWKSPDPMWGVEVDHIVPLYRVARDFRHLPWQALLRYWSPENLQVLCHACHVEKCGQEARERAARARFEKLPPGQLELL